MGVHRALNAVDAALSNVLVESRKLKSAKGLLVNVVGGNDLTLHEVTKSVRKLQGIIHPDANIIFGANIDPSSGDKVMITFIATGIEDCVSEDPPRIGFYQAIDPEEKRENEKQNRLREEQEPEESHIAFDSLLEDDLDVPTYLRRNKRYSMSHSKENPK
jgi:cell division protein FtsZ